MFNVCHRLIQLYHHPWGAPHPLVSVFSQISQTIANMETQICQILLLSVKKKQFQLKYSNSFVLDLHGFRFPEGYLQSLGQGSKTI